METSKSSGEREVPPAMAPLFPSTFLSEMLSKEAQVSLKLGDMPMSCQACVGISCVRTLRGQKKNLHVGHCLFNGQVSPKSQCHN